MKIDYVISTMIFWFRESRISLETECEYIKSLGYGIELWPNTPDLSLGNCQFARRNWERLRNATEGMLVCMRSRNDSPDIEQWLEQIQCAEFLGAHIVADLKSLHVPRDSGQVDFDFISRIVDLAGEHGVELCIETGRLSTLEFIGEKFDSLSFCFDVGYAHLDPVYSFEEYVDKLARRLRHLHLCDNYGELDDHEPPGLRGGIPREKWQYLLEKISEYDIDLVGSFEMSPCRPDVMIRQASEFIFGELNWPGKPDNSGKIRAYQR